MIKALILDFDQTLVDTSSLSPYRLSGQWDTVLKMLLKLKPYSGIDAVFDYIHQHNIPTFIVTASPKALVLAYARKMKWPIIEVFDVYNNQQQKRSKLEAFLEAIAMLETNVQHVASLSDLNDDARYANQLKLISLHAGWSQEISLDALKTFKTPKAFLTFLKEQHKTI